jgi:hypothetical protein
LRFVLKQAFRRETIPRARQAFAISELGLLGPGTSAALPERAALEWHDRRSRSSRRRIQHMGRRQEREEVGMTRRSAFAIALLATLLMATGAQAQSYPPRDDTQAPRGQDLQSPRGDNEDVQAPRGTGQDVQAPRGQ